MKKEYAIWSIMLENNEMSSLNKWFKSVKELEPVYLKHTLNGIKKNVKAYEREQYIKVVRPAMVAFLKENYDRYRWFATNTRQGIINKFDAFFDLSKK